MNFHYRSNSEKIIDYIFQQIKKTLFLSHFPYFGTKSHMGPQQYAVFQKKKKENFQISELMATRTKEQKNPQTDPNS